MLITDPSDGQQYSMIPRGHIMSARAAISALSLVVFFRPYFDERNDGKMEEKKLLQQPSQRILIFITISHCNNENHRAHRIGRANGAHAIFNSRSSLIHMSLYFPPTRVRCPKHPSTQPTSTVGMESPYLLSPLT